MYKNVVASICEGTFSSLKKNKVVANPARLFSSVQDLPSKKTSVEENRCAAEAGHRKESCPTKAVKRKKKEISTKKAIPAASTSASKATSEELNTIEAKLTKKCEKVAFSSTAKPTVPPTKKTTSVKKALEVIWCKKPRSQRRKKNSQDVGKPQMRSHYQLLQGDSKKVSCSLHI
ncbi:unnamed protein product [Arabis nemorensis]|uniref:Uncharacterized protein n=1 Tax=Arabis nemorensis TaxID=586526 RepID=A0A565C1L8_9BRAS|nr:unnamed protein product [Arabis nemorensis]